MEVPPTPDRRRQTGPAPPERCAMSLHRRERSELRRMEAAFRESDPALADLFSGLQELADAEFVSAAEEDRSGGAALAVSMLRLAARGAAAAAAAVCAPGVRERLGVRMHPQPMARSTWHRLT